MQHPEQWKLLFDAKESRMFLTNSLPNILKLTPSKIQLQLQLIRPLPPKNLSPAHAIHPAALDDQWDEFLMSLLSMKEPDNLPLHEPWYSRLSQYHRLIVISALRPDKLLELVHTFVSDKLGFKFVEPCNYQLARIYSDGESHHPVLIYRPSGIPETGTGEDRVADAVRKLAKSKETQLEVISLGDEESVRTVKAWTKKLVFGV